MQLEKERQRELQVKKKRAEDKESHSLEVRKQMEAREFQRIGSIKAKREEKEQGMLKTQSQKEWEFMIHKEMEMIKREEKVENVQRISKAQEYMKEKIVEKIQYDNAKSEHLRREKEKLLETRFMVRRVADK